MLAAKRVFLDSNLLFSASRDEQSDFRRLWTLPDVEILLSQYVIDEVSRHLRRPSQRAALWQFVYRSHLVPNGDEVTLPDHVTLPQKDVPILQGAIAGSADILVTGDLHHFTQLFGSTIMGVLVEETAAFKARYPAIFPAPRS